MIKFALEAESNALRSATHFHWICKCVDVNIDVSIEVPYVRHVTSKPAAIECKDGLVRNNRTTPCNEINQNLCCPRLMCNEVPRYNVWIHFSLMPAASSFCFRTITGRRCQQHTAVATSACFKRCQNFRLFLCSRRWSGQPYMQPNYASVKLKYVRARPWHLSSKSQQLAGRLNSA